MADFDLRDTVAAGAPSVRKHGQTLSAANHTILQNVTTMKAYLSGLGAPKNYTAARLNAMTRNDLVSACKIELGIS